MNSIRDRLVHMLVEAGWTNVRDAARGGHELWRCPCGRHSCTIPKTGSRDVGVSPIQSRIRACPGSQKTQAKTPPFSKETDLTRKPGDREWPPAQPPIQEVRSMPTFHDLVGSDAAAIVTAVSTGLPKPTPPPPARTVNGVAVIATEPATLQHPQWAHDRSRDFTTDRVLKALLADDTVVHLCPLCEYSAPKAQSVQSHRGAAHDRSTPAGPLTPVATIKRVLQEARRARTSGVRGYAEAAAEALNRAGVVTYRGDAWNPGLVSAVCKRYNETYPEEMPMPRPRTARRSAADAARSVAAAAAPSVEPAGQDDLVAAMEGVAKALAIGVADLLEAIRLLKAQPRTDPEMAAKAAKWDQVKGLLG